MQSNKIAKICVLLRNNLNTLNGKFVTQDLHKSNEFLLMGVVAL